MSRVSQRGLQCPGRSDRTHTPARAAELAHEAFREQRARWVAEESRNAFIAAGYTRTQAREVIFITALKTISHYTHHLAETPLDAAFAEQKWTRPN